MARQRTLHPDFFTDERVVSVSFAARLLFQGLWTEADREGRLECKPLTLKMRLFPADAVDIVVLLAELFGAGLVRRYEVDGLAYLLVPKLPKRQHFHPKEMPSRFPAPPPEEAAGNVPGVPGKGAPQPETILANPAGPSGSTGPSGSSTSSAAGKSAGEPEKPEEGKLSDDALWEGLQRMRDEHMLEQETVRPHKWPSWCREARKFEPGQIGTAYAAFLRDFDFRDRGWPMGVFITEAVWRRRTKLPSTDRDSLTGIRRGA